MNPYNNYLDPSTIIADPRGVALSWVDLQKDDKMPNLRTIRQKLYAEDDRTHEEFANWFWSVQAGPRLQDSVLSTPEAIEYIKRKFVSKLLKDAHTISRFPRESRVAKKILDSKAKMEEIKRIQRMPGVDLLAITRAVLSLSAKQFERLSLSQIIDLCKSNFYLMVLIRSILMSEQQVRIGEYYIEDEFKSFALDIIQQKGAFDEKLLD